MPDNNSSKQTHERRLSTAHLNAPSQVLVVSLALFGIYQYGRFIFNPANRGNFIPWIVVLFCEAFMMFQAAMAMWTILVGGHDPRDYRYNAAQEQVFSPELDIAIKRERELHIEDKAMRRRLKRRILKLHGRKATVDVLIPTYGESVEAIRRTATAARDILGKHDTYILDESGRQTVRDMAAEIGVKYVNRPEHRAYKAGNLNYALQNVSKAEFFVVFDADFVADPMFLYETLPFFASAEVAFVQTPQHYGNLHNVISRGAGYMQRVFYRLIQPGKNRFNAAFCVGTNVIFRRSAVDAVGGMYEGSLSEDIWTSLLLHERGYRSVFIPDILAVGDTPDTIKAYTKQQLRWATGGFEILFRRNPLFSPLAFDQKLQYLFTSLYYFQGIAIGLLLTLPALHVFFNLSPVNLNITLWQWFVYYMGFYGLQILVAFYTMGGFRLETLVLSSVSFPIYVQGVWNAMLGRKQKWHVTGNRSADSPFNYIVPQVIIFLFLTFTTVMAVYNMVAQGQAFSLAIIWNGINAVTFGCFMVIAWREHRELRKEFKASDVTLVPQQAGAKL
ncbi:MAG TPA: glycosyltransferase family 2 protein [Candidatus Saccharimonadales bacterium]